MNGFINRIQRVTWGFLILLFSMEAFASSPSESAQFFFKNLIGLSQASSHSVREEKLIAFFTSHFDFPEFYERALVDHWSGWTTNQRQEFDRIFRKKFTDNLSNNLNRLNRMAGARMSQKRIETKGPYASIEIEGGVEETSIAVRLYLVKEANDWKVYDLDIEGAKLSRNYRGSFNYALRRYGFGGLLAKLKDFRSKSANEL